MGQKILIFLTTTLVLLAEIYIIRVFFDMKIEGCLLLYLFSICVYWQLELLLAKVAFLLA